MRKFLKTLVMIALSLLVGWVAGSWRTDRNSPMATSMPAVSSLHTGPTIEQVQALAMLVTTRVEVADVQETRLAGYTGGIRAVLLIKGDYLLGTNLSQAKFESVDESTRHAVLILPQPCATSPRIDHDRTRIFAITDTGLWQVTVGDNTVTPALINRAYGDAQRCVVEASQGASLLNQSRRRAEEVLGAFFAAIGWRVEVRWAE